MGKKRNALLNEAQIELIKAIVGEYIVLVGNKMRYTDAPDLNDPNDIPNYAAVLNITGGGLRSDSFDSDQLLGDEDSGFYLPYTLPEDEATLVMLVKYDDRPNEISFVQYSFSDSAIIGFVNKNNVTSIKVWATGSNAITPTPPAPIFSVQPSPNVTVLQGQSLNLTASASNTLYYQWMKDGVDLAGENTGNLTVTDFNPSKAGTYSVRAIGDGGTVVSDNSVVINDSGVLVNNFTSQDISGGSHSGVDFVATDGTNVLNVSIGTQVRLKSGVTINISGYGSVPLVSQDGLGNTSDMLVNSQSFNSPVNSPLGIYHSL